MTRNVITATPKTEVREIVDLMIKNRISAVPVVDGGRVIGMVSEGDLMRRVENNTDRRDSWWLSALFSARNDVDAYVKSRGRRAEDVMTRDPICISEDTPLYKIAQTLEKNHIKRVPVVTGGKLVGIVSRSNLLQGFSTMQKDTPAGAGDDKSIRAAIVKEMEDKLDISENSTNVVVVDGVVTLWGLVQSEAQRKGAAIAAENTAGVKEVHNNLSVSPTQIGSY
ncbi:MAG: CBS domain-containing protein [Pseudazoarcus pumilus]|nr:CBS domain-containing protein [Pseudazoarcus pumilus]